MAPKVVSSAPCQEIVREGADVDLGRIPVQTCWPGDAGPLITWGLTVTPAVPSSQRQNLGIYRQQVIGRNKVIMRWLPTAAGRSTSGTTSRRNPASPSRWRWRSGPIQRRSWVP